jgi:hypothetical protein
MPSSDNPLPTGTARAPGARDGPMRRQEPLYPQREIPDAAIGVDDEPESGPALERRDRACEREARARN